jgi:hypothetical protein
VRGVVDEVFGCITALATDTMYAMRVRLYQYVPDILTLYYRRITTCSVAGDSRDFNSNHKAEDEQKQHAAGRQCFHSSME